MFKRRIIFFHLVFLCTVSFSQSNQTLIQYKNGFRELNRIFLSQMLKKKGIQGVQSDSIKYNRYFNVVMEVAKDGSIDSILVISIMDSSKGQFIIDGLKKTQGNWINKSGVTQMVVLPIYLIYKSGNEKDPIEKTPFIRQDFYTNWNNRSLIHLEPIIIELYAPMS
jgi:hypothetical protein